ncbi:hypothetical protein D3C81_1411080 [compost metagenome]
MTQDRGDIDDRAGFAGNDQALGHFLSHEERAGEVGIQQGRPLRATHFLEGCRIGQPGIVDQHIDQAKLTLDTVESLLDGGAIGDIQNTGESLAALGADIRRHRLDPVQTPSHAGHLGPCPGQNPGKVGTQPGACSGHQGYAALQRELVLHACTIVIVHCLHSMTL